MKMLMMKQGLYLIPCFDSDAENLKACRLKNGETYQVEIKRPRNIDHHRKMFALYNLCFENQQTFECLEDMRYYLTCKAGYYKRVETLTGEMIIPKSISFAKMDQTEFNLLYKATLNAVCNFLDITEPVLLTELINFM